MTGVLKEGEAVLHGGEIEAQRRFGDDNYWHEQKLSQLVKRDISDALGSYLEQIPFFFIATSDESGHCDCSYRGREYNVSGEPLLALKVLSRNTLVFPEFKGNKLYNSVGNILVNPHIGMLFIDFESRRRVRVNGRAQLVERWPEMSLLWPSAQGFIKVTTEQVYPNCRARVPRMRMEAPPDHLFQEGDL